MNDPRFILAMCVASDIDHCEAIRLRRLRKRLFEERIRVERARMLRMRHYQTAPSLPSPNLSPWMFLWYFGTDVNFINTTGLCRRAFMRLLSRFALFYAIPAYRRRGGRPRKLQHHHQVLGLLLAFYVDSMGQKGLCSKFGVPPATLCRVLNDAEIAMNRALIGFLPARIVWPSPARQRMLARLTAARHPLLPFTWGFIDGKNLRVQEPSDRDLQNAHYNGWLHAVFVTGTLCFSADGLIVWSKHNYPGSWNDADTSLEFREKLLDRNLNPDPRYGIIADSAFPCGDDMRGRIMTPLKEGDLARLMPSVRAVAHRKSKAITYIRQAIEWGMGSVGKVFHRLALPMPYDVQKRRIRLDNLFRLSNYRVRTVEISQIRTTFVYGTEDNSVDNSINICSCLCRASLRSSASRSSNWRLFSSLSRSSLDSLSASRRRCSSRFSRTICTSCNLVFSAASASSLRTCSLSALSRRTASKCSSLSMRRRRSSASARRSLSFWKNMRSFIISPVLLERLLSASSIFFCMSSSRCCIRILLDLAKDAELSFLADSAGDRFPFSLRKD